MLVDGLKKLDLFGHSISISQLSRGFASKILNKLINEEQTYFITKHSKLSAVMLPINDYKKLLEIQEDMNLIITAQERIKNSTKDDYLPYSDLLNKFNITENKLEGIEVEFE